MRRRMFWKLLKYIVGCVTFVFVVVEVKWTISLHYLIQREQNGFVFPDVRKNVSGSHANYRFPEADSLVKSFLARYNNVFTLTDDESHDGFLKRLSSRRPKGKMLVQEAASIAKNSLDRFHRGINQFYMYDPNDEITMDELLHDLKTQPIVSSDGVLYVGSQMKALLNFADASQARFKPARKPHYGFSTIDVYYWEDHERATAEIAAFYLDRVLGFNRAVPTVGRVLNMTSDLASLLSNKTYVQDVYTSPGGNMCFIANCLQLCGKYFPFCGHPDVIDGAVSAFFPPETIYSRSRNNYPYIHNYSLTKKADWYYDEHFCDKFVKNTVSAYTVLEFMEISISDFLIGNSDRHAYLRFADLGVDSFVINYDNGRGFGKSSIDCMDCLTALKQCCQIRLSTLAKLIKLYKGPDSLSHLMRTALNSDPLSPVLLEPHLDALDRRLGKVIVAVSECIHKGRSWEDVVVDDLGPL